MRYPFRRPRWLHRWYANWAEYFWLPCPICGEDFGGHELITMWWKTRGSGVGICPNCVEEAHRRNRAIGLNV